MANLKIKEAYEAVFDENGNIKVCGRTACINLIEACEEEDQETYFGNKKTGVLCENNYERMKELYLNSK